jgi:hypothetical protein
MASDAPLSPLTCINNPPTLQAKSTAKRHWLAEPSA